MDPEADPPKTLTVRHKCSACYKQYKKKEHLIEHMKVSYHSVHQPKCPVCKKHCKSFESVREHLTGPLRKADCSKIFNAQGCDLCLNVFESSDALTLHKELCCFSPPVLLGSSIMSSPDFEMESSAVAEENCTGQVLEAVALDCEMVGAGSDGSLDICARVCLVDESEKVIFHAYVRPLLPVTNYRFEITGITEENLRDAMPHKEVQEKVQEILYNGESIWKTRLDGGKARLLVGHDLDHDLDCLRIAYPDHLLRDTAIYRPLMKTNLISHSLKYLTRTYLGYEIQTGAHDPYEDCVAAMRLYKRIRTQAHQTEGFVTSDATQYINTLVNIFDSSKLKALMNMAPDDLYKMSRSNYRCWCMDARPVMQS